MSDEVGRNAIQRELKSLVCDARFEESESEVRIIFPKSTAMRSVVIGCITAVFCIAVSAIFLRSLLVPRTENVVVALVGTVTAILGVGLGVGLIVQLTARERHDVLVVSVDGIRVEQWCQTLERDTNLKWQYVLAYAFRQSGLKDRRELHIKLGLGREVAITLNRPISNEGKVIACLDQFRLIRSDIEASIPDDYRV